MLYYVHYKGKEYRVCVESKEGKLLVSLGGKEKGIESLEVFFYGNDCTLLANHKVFHANVVGTRESYTISRSKGNLQFEVESEYKRLVGKLRGQSLEAENHVYSKMPGKIIKLMSKIGDLVEQGTPVLVMEAMKMENEIRSPIAGKIIQILVKEGQAVESGSLLIEIAALV